MTESPYPSPEPTSDDQAPDVEPVPADDGSEIVDRQIVRSQRTGGLEQVETNARGEIVSRERYDHPADAPPLA